MSRLPSDKPYQSLGTCLKQLRVRLQKTLVEVSGAVEIDPEVLKAIEQGQTRPAEDILLLLINHFDITKDEATKLWSLAGYEMPKDEDDAEDNPQKQLAVLMPLDNRIMFTDDILMNGNRDSLVIQFMQTDLLTYQTLPVARVGMTTDQAKKLFEQLRQTLYYNTEPKALPAPNIKTTKTDQPN